MPGMTRTPRQRTALPANVSPLVPALAARIVDIIRREGLPLGHRLTEQSLCDELGVSRSPVRKALQFLQTTGVVSSQANRGFQVARAASELGALALPTHAESDEAVYMRIADDRLAAKLPDEVSETDLMDRYSLSRLQVQRALNRMAREGMVERKAGRGWLFLPLLTTTDSYRESYRFRMVIEPAAILEPGYQVDRAELEKCRREQVDLLAGGIETWSRSELFRTGVHLHETIVAGANNRFLLDAMRKVNQLRRLLEYRSKRDRAQTSIYMRQQCTEHLVLIDLLLRNERVEAAHFLRNHLDGAKEIKATPAPVAARRAKPG
jgi:DNA-binding GntR family transcriptional regulator